MKKRNLLLIIIFLFNFVSIIAQVKEDVEQFIEKSTSETGDQPHKARDYVKLKAGYSYIATAGNSMHAWTDPDAICNTDYLTGNDVPNASSRVLDYSLSVGTSFATFDVNQIGAAIYNLPLVCPPGLQGLEPKIVLSYNSQNRNGIAGYGFDISGLSVITRESQNNYHDNGFRGLKFDLNDRFSIDGTRLILVDGLYYGAINSKYAKYNDDFSVISSHETYKNTGPDWFEVTAKNGTKYKYGSSTGKLIYNDGVKEAVAAWYLDYVEDVFGNFISYTYKSDGIIILIDEITYGSNRNINTIGINSIKFIYEKRDDEIPVVIGIKKQENNNILSRIVTRTNDNIFRKYDLAYKFDDYSWLKSIKESNSNGDNFNPILIDWETINHSNFKECTYPSISQYINSEWWRYNRFYSSDINGDGLEDIISVNSPNNGDASTIKISNAIKDEESNSVNFEDYNEFQVNSTSLDDSYQKGLNFCFDMDADGLNELIVPEPATISKGNYLRYSVYEANFEQSEVIRTPYINLLPGSTTFNLPLHVVSDFNRDSYGDIVYVEKAKNIDGSFPIVYLFNTDNISSYTGSPNNGGTSTFKLFKSNIYFDENQVPEKMIQFDYNQDGLIDLMILTNKYYYIFKNNGTVCLSNYDSNQPDFDVFDPNYVVKSDLINSEIDTFNSGEVMPGDFNGDGLIDFLTNTKKTSKWYFCINKGDGYFEKILVEIDAENTHENGVSSDDRDNEMDNVLCMDFNQDGKTDIIVFDGILKKVNNTWYEFDYLTVKWFSSNGESVNCENTKTTRVKNYAWSNHFFTGDFDGDNRTDLINWGFDCWSGDQEQFWRIYSNNDSELNDGRINFISNGLKNEISLEYSNTVQGDIYSFLENFAEKPLLSFHYPLSVVSNVSYTASTERDVFYTYQNGVVHPLLGFLGFNQIEQVDNDNVQTSIFDFKYVSKQGNDYFFPMEKETFLTIGGVTKHNSIWYNEFEPDGNRIFLYPETTSIIDNYLKSKIITTSTYNEIGNLLNSKIEYADLADDVYLIKNTKYDDFCDAVIDENKVVFWPRLMTQSTENPKSNEGNKLNFETTLVYNEFGQVTKETQFSNLNKKIIIDFEYEITGNLKLKTVVPDDLDEMITSFSYDPTGRFVNTEVNPLLQIINCNTDVWGNVIQKKDPSGLLTKYKFDGWGNLSESILPDGTKNNYSIGWSGEDGTGLNYLYCKTDLVNGTFEKSSYFDDLGRTLREVSKGYEGSKYYSDKKYNSFGQIMEESDNYLSTSSIVLKTSYIYTSDGRIGTKTLSNGTIITYGYSPTSNEITETYSDGSFYSKEYNPGGFLIKASDPGNDIDYYYNRAGLMHQISTSNKGTSIIMTYTERGEQEYLNDPDAGTIHYIYDALGQIKQQEDGNMIVTYNTYDKLGRILTKQIGTETTKNIYNPTNGLLERIEKGENNVIIYSYDRLYRIIKEERIVNSISMVFKTDYNADNLISKITYPNNFYISYSYNTNKDLINIKDPLGCIVWQMDELNDVGMIKKVSYGNGKQLEYGYDSENRLNGVYVSNLLDFKYGFNEKQQLEFRDEKYFSGTAWQGFRENFRYDDVDRLKTADNGVVNTLTMTYVQNQEKSDRIIAKAGIGNYIYNKDDNHRLDYIEATTSYIPPKQNISMSGFNKISQLSEGSKVANFTYAANEERFKMEILGANSSNVTRYYFGSYEKEVLANGTVRHLNYISSPTGLVAIVEQMGSTTTTNYVYLDYLGSLRCVTNSTGQIIEKLSFDAWGNRRNPITGTNGQPSTLLYSRGFTGHEHLDAFGLINMNGRMYDPAISLFLSPDNFVQSPDFSQNFNRYAYCLNNPLKYTDPSGEIIGWVILGGVIVGGYVVGSLSADDPNPRHWSEDDWKAAAIGGIATGGAIFGGMYLYGALPGTIGYNIASNAFFMGNMCMGATALATNGDLDATFEAGVKGFASGAVVGGLSSWKINNPFEYLLKRNIANNLDALCNDDHLKISAGPIIFDCKDKKLIYPFMKGMTGAQSVYLAGEILYESAWLMGNAKIWGRLRNQVSTGKLIDKFKNPWVFDGAHYVFNAKNRRNADKVFKLLDGTYNEDLIINQFIVNKSNQKTKEIFENKFFEIMDYYDNRYIRKPR